MKVEAKGEQPAHLELGRRGERFALEYLKYRAGYRIVATNFAIPLGRNLRGAPIVGEVDIIGYDGDVLAFVEVKTRTSEDVAAAEAAVDRRKQRTIARTARAYRRLMKLGEVPYRFDVLTVVFHPPQAGGRGAVNSSPEITLEKGFFSDEKMKGHPAGSFYES